MTTTAATTDRAGRWTALGLLLAAIAVSAATFLGVRPELIEDDRPVDRTTPAAQRAVAVARGVVRGAVVDVRRDADNGKWEVTLRAGDRSYEVELAPGDLDLLRIDYD
jgi:hypothetical protein